jgi:hypothetical protein
MNWLQSIASNLFYAVGAVANWAAKKLDLNNTPEMKARAAAQAEIDRKSAAEKAVKDQNEKAVRENLAD